MLFSVLNDECASVGHREGHLGIVSVYSVAIILVIVDHSVHVVELFRVSLNVSIEVVDL
jgi:hypothetical protein